MDLHPGYSEVSVAPVQGHAAQEQRLLLSYAPLVKRITRQLSSQVGGAIDREDMEQIGLLGLLDALRRYGMPDEKFPAYAALRVRGAILDELRRQDWRPRAVRQESHKLRDAVRALTRQLGREPTDAEIIAATGIDDAAYHAYLLNENAETLASFDELLHELSNQPDQGMSPEAQFIRRRSLEQALLSLDEREQRVIQLYYEYELSFKEIAAVLGLTDARVCQINKGALKKMRNVLCAD
ncbi:MAG TPA: FliA/WhiG family RNA polymerase sigma factor [Aquabacterium sp.]|nr:FliA/WhiG family RNA polymerase sigma factor [Aquabacterium sp.]